jgi:hypothetical protein
LSSSETRQGGNRADEGIRNRRNERRHKIKVQAEILTKKRQDENDPDNDEQPVRLKLGQWLAYRRRKKTNGNAAPVQWRDRQHIEDRKNNIDDYAIDKVLNDPIGDGAGWMRSAEIAAKSMFVPGPAKATQTMPLCGFLSAEKFTGTGLA